MYHVATIPWEIQIIDIIKIGKFSAELLKIIKKIIIYRTKQACLTSDDPDESKIQR